MTQQSSKKSLAKIVGRQGDKTLVARRKPDGNTDLLVVGRLKEGQALPPGESLFELSNQDGQLYVETIVQGKGPAKVTSPAYRNNFDGVFPKKRRPKKELLN